MTELAAAAKKVVTVPVIAVGRLDSPEVAEKVISEGKADIVAIGKGLLADPHWVKKVEEGKAEDIRPCIACHDGCMGRLVAGKPISCSVNPSCGRERSYRLEPTLQEKHIIVVGGGVAGLEAARVASIRGHKVDLYEKSDRLGGHVEEAMVMPFKIGEAKLLNWYRNQLDRLSVDIHLNREVEETFLVKAKADTVVLATGSEPMGLSMPEAASDRVVTTIDLLTGKRKPGEKVVVIGGGRVGCETALWLAQKGKNVTILEKLGEVMKAGIPVPRMNRLMLLDLIKFYRVSIITGANLVNISEGVLVIEDGSKQHKEIEADTIAIAVGLTPDQRLFRSLSGRIPNVYVIGDAKKVRNIMGAIWDAYEVARSI